MIAKRHKKRKSYQKILLSLFSIIFISGVVGFLFYSSWKTYQQRRELDLRAESLKSEIEALQEKKNELEIMSLQFGKEEYLEKVAREQFNLQKPGEQVVTILPPEEEEKEEKPEEKKSFWQGILDKLGF